MGPPDMEGDVDPMGNRWVGVDGEKRSAAVSTGEDQQISAGYQGRLLIQFSWVRSIKPWVSSNACWCGIGPLAMTTMLSSMTPLVPPVGWGCSPGGGDPCGLSARRVLVVLAARGSQRGPPVTPRVNIVVARAEGVLCDFSFQAICCLLTSCGLSSSGAHGRSMYSVPYPVQQPLLGASSGHCAGTE